MTDVIVGQDILMFQSTSSPKKSAGDPAASRCRESRQINSWAKRLRLPSPSGTVNKDCIVLADLDNDKNNVS